jgi:hypothetical protein
VSPQPKSIELLGAVDCGENEVVTIVHDPYIFVDEEYLQIIHQQTVVH